MQQSKKMKWKAWDAEGERDEGWEEEREHVEKMEGWRKMRSVQQEHVIEE